MCDNVILIFFLFNLASYDFDNYAQMSEILKFKVTEKFGDENKGRKSEANMETFIATHTDREECPPPPEDCVRSFGIQTHADSFPTHLLNMQPYPTTSFNHDQHYPVERHSILPHGMIDRNYQRRLILHFAFDVSGSIGPHYLQKSIEFAKAVVKKVNLNSFSLTLSDIVEKNL